MSALKHLEGDWQTGMMFGRIRCQVLNALDNIVQMNTAVIGNIMNYVPSTNTGDVITGCSSGTYTSRCDSKSTQEEFACRQSTVIRYVLSIAECMKMCHAIAIFCEC